MFDQNLLGLLMQGGFTIFILLVCSILSIKVIIEKFIQFNCLKEKYVTDFSDIITDLLKERDLKGALSVCKTYRVPSLYFKLSLPLANVFKYIFHNTHLTKEELFESAYNKLDQEIVKLEKGLGVLATLGAISPFIGLFGTVVGIIKSFSALSSTDTSHYAHVMSGIAEALIATAAGLFVAVPSVLFYNYFTKRIKLTLPLFDEAIQNLIRTLKNSKG
ncbi:MAG: MotA/TolQ/ExbB proton channel family protein [Ignavibacteriales bacterium]|nr:MotA/TolQ/ExbB proton channel family protein [Ignavibacteriales bacterium]